MLPVKFWCPGRVPTAGKCTSLSLGGMFIKTADVEPYGSHLHISLTFPDRQTMLLGGVVRWVTREGIGIQHELLGARDTYTLSTFLASVEPSSEPRD